MNDIKNIIKLFAIMVLAFCFSIIPCVLALVMWNPYMLLFYIPLIAEAIYLAIKFAD